MVHVEPSFWMNALVPFIPDSSGSLSNINHSELLSVVSSSFPPVFQMGILISAGFIVSWTPYVFISLWTMFHSEGKDSMAPIVSLLPCLFAKCSTAYNPFVYYVFRKSFRRELRQIRMCCYQGCWNAVSKMTRGEPSEENSGAQKTGEEWTHNDRGHP